MRKTFFKIEKRNYQKKDVFKQHIIEKMFNKWERRVIFG